MRFSALCLAALAAAVTNVVKAEEAATTCAVPPFVGAKLMMNGQIVSSDDNSNAALFSNVADVHGCCGVDETNKDVYTRPTIGKMAQMTSAQTLAVLKDAEQAWNGGSGAWPQMSLKQRLEAVENLLQDLETNQREVMVETLMWEIGKNRKDAESEFDRTMQFGRQVMDVVKSSTEFGGSWQNIGSTMAFVRRAAVGIVLCLGPMNYPLNETYATLIPALLMGNVVVMKIPTVGGLVHLLTMEAFQKALPAGAMNFVSGRGRETMPTLMETGKVDALAFIGGSSAADTLIRQHPHPHRLKIFLQLEAKNMAIFLPDLLKTAPEEEKSKALDQAVLGALSFNGQRCTALKIFFVPKGTGQDFSKQMAERINAMKVGLPWETVDVESAVYSHITPLPDKKRIELMQRLIKDAVAKGAKIVNERGGEIIGGDESTLMVPAVLYPVTPDMD
ncbi:MAG: hypothetical protein SGARI_002973, partial [Bacillariaceae sp.]